MGNNQYHETVEKAQPNLSFPPNLLQSLEKIVFELNESNIDETDKIVKLYINFPYTFNLALSQLIYASFVSQKKDFNTYFTFIKIIDTKEKGVITNDNTLIKIFTNYLLHLDSQESNFLLEKMIESQIISSNSIEKKATLYFAHRISNETLKKIKTEDNIPFSKYFNDNMQELQKNDWELHRRLIKDGVNPNEVLKIIRNDEIGKLQEMLSQSNFVLNQKIIPSLYEKYSFINQNNISLTDYAAFFGSINCFKHLLINGCKLNNTGKFAVAGGNEEIIHLCIQNHAPLNNIYESAIEFHQNDIFQYLYENKIEEINDFTKLAKKCIESSNYEILSFLRKSANLNYKKSLKNLLNMVI